MNLPNASTARPPDGPGEAAGREHVVRAGRVVAGRFRRPRARRRGRAGVADARDGRLERLDIDRQVFGAVVVDEGDRGVEVRREDDPAVLGERALRGCRGGRAVARRASTSASTASANAAIGRHEDGRRVRAVLGLGDEVGRDDVGSRRRVGQDEAFGRAGGQVDADLAADLDLGGGHPGVARPDDPVDGLDAGVRQAEGERADRLRAAGHDEGVDAEQAGGAEEDRVGAAIRVGRRGDDDALDAGDLGRDDGHHQRRRVRGASRPGRSTDRLPAASQRRSISMPGAIVVVGVVGRWVSAKRRTCSIAWSRARRTAGSRASARPCELARDPGRAGRRAGRRRRASFASRTARRRRASRTSSSEVPDARRGSRDPARRRAGSRALAVGDGSRVAGGDAARSRRRKADAVRRWPSDVGGVIGVTGRSSRSGSTRMPLRAGGLEPRQQAPDVVRRRRPSGSRSCPRARAG